MKPAKLSPALQSILKKTPLASRSELDRVMRGDLEFGAEQYARQAMFDGGASWSVYFALQTELGRGWEESVHHLPQASCESLAKWAFAEGRDDVGVMAIERILEADDAPTGLRDLVDPYVQATINAWGRDAGAEALARIESKVPRAPAKAPPTSTVLGSAFRIVPCADRSRHSFGGFDLEMPDCPACGDKLRLWFSLDVEAEPSLLSSLPGWSMFPLMGCGSCRVWMFQIDYQLDVDTTAAQIVRVHAESDAVRASAQARARTPPIPRTNAMLVFNNAATAVPEPVVGGEPHFGGMPRAVDCWGCRKPMRFIASMATPRGFTPAVTISGWQDHFACAACRTVSVVPQ